MLEICGLSVSYGQVPALRDVSLSAKPGALTVLLGSNGAGKSTLVKAVMGLLDHENCRGSITFEGHALQGFSTETRVQKGLSYVPEGRSLFDQLSVAENLKVGAYMTRDRQRLQQDLASVYALFPRLAERRQQMAGSLSGGEQQMLAMGRAMMNRPRFLLLDEPSLGLAPRMVDEVFRLIEQLCTQGLGILWVEQNALRSLSLASYGYVLEAGRLSLEGRAELLLNNPALRQAYLGKPSAGQC